MTREQVAERARRAIPDFLRRRKPDPPKVPPVNRGEDKPRSIDWDYLFKLARNDTAAKKGE